MSRGGRGASRGGRGGAVGRGGKQRIGGQEVSWDYDPELEVSSKPTELFPHIEVPTSRPLSRFEWDQVARFKAIRSRIRTGPMHAVLGDDVRVGKERLTRTARFDPFAGNTSYTQKYKPPSRKLPKFNTRKHATRVFPDELVEVIDPSKGPSTATKVTGKRKRAQQDAEGDAEEQDAENEDGTGRIDPDEDHEEEENPDENFSDDESDMAGDYNAEGYFDAGEHEDDDLGGDDGGGDYD